MLSTHQRIRRTLYVALFIIVILFGVIFRNGSESIQSLTQKADWVKHTDLVLDEIARTLSLMKDAETGQRGYLISKDSVFLELYLHSQDSVNVHFTTLKKLTLDNPSQQQHIKLLREAIDRKFAYMQEGIFQINGKMNSLYSLAEGKRRMDEVRRLSQVIQTEEEQLMRTRIGEQEQTILRAKSLIYWSITLFVLVVIGSLVMITRLLRQNEWRTRETIRLNESLKVANRELAASNEELASTTEELRSSNEALATTMEELTASSEELRAINEKLEEARANLEKRVEERTVELTASKERYRIFIQQSSEAIWRLELDGITGIPTDLPEEEQIELYYRHVYLAECNDTMARMYGYTTASEIVGARLCDMLPSSIPDNAGYLRNFIRSDYRLTDALSTELDREGNVKYFLNNLLGMVEDNRLIRAWGTQRDVTESKKAEEAIRESQERFRLFIESIPHMAWTLLPDGRMSYFNQRWYDYTGQTPEIALSSKRPSVSHPDELPEVTQRWQQAFTTAQPYERETRYRRFDGIYRWHLTRSVPIRNEHGEVILWVGTATDTHELKTAIEHLAETKEQLETRNQELLLINNDLDSFVYATSHDLKSPVTNLEGLISMLGKKLTGRLNEEEDQLMSFIQSSILKLKIIIKDLAEVVRVQKEPLEEAESLSFEQMLEEVKDSIREQIEQAGAIIRTDFAVETLTYARRHLRSILYNLLSNAIKYRTPGRQPEIDVRTHASEEGIVLTITDNGLGLANSQIPRMFTMFKRFHNHIEGTGIGLYIIKKILENKGDSVKVESTEGQGTTFTVTFRQKTG